MSPTAIPQSFSWLWETEARGQVCGAGAGREGAGGPGPWWPAPGSGSHTGSTGRPLPPGPAVQVVCSLPAPGHLDLAQPILPLQKGSVSQPLMHWLWASVSPSLKGGTHETAAVPCGWRGPLRGLGHRVERGNGPAPAARAPRRPESEVQAWTGDGSCCLTNQL